MSTASGASFITGVQGWLTPGPGAPPPMTGSPGTQPPILTRSGGATWHRTVDTWPDSWIKTTLPKVWGDKSGRTKIDLINTQTKESQTQLGQSHKVKLNGKSWQMTGKEERTKTEMKNADKQGMVREMGSLVTLVTSDIRIHRDLTSQTLAAVNTQTLQIPFSWWDCQKKTKYKQQTGSLNCSDCRDGFFNNNCSCYTAFDSNRQLKDGVFWMLKV